eukprot:Seg1347.5 transcript_id=Seg1347.5/GoldUCD/mRNA.D3Y31 product="5-hydroxyisourate hydrolase" protein_id=Seg1347.5/GoldUCD/D3Y31
MKQEYSSPNLLFTVVGFTIVLSQVAVAAKEESPLSIHVLDVSKGLPGNGMEIECYKEMQGNWTTVRSGSTDNDGRFANLISARDFDAGTYKLVFNLSQYFTKEGKDYFHPFAEVMFRINNTRQNYHVPLLVTPYSYTTYRGSKSKLKPDDKNVKNGARPQGKVEITMLLFLAMKEIHMVILHNSTLSVSHRITERWHSFEISPTCAQSVAAKAPRKQVGNSSGASSSSSKTPSKKGGYSGGGGGNPLRICDVPSWQKGIAEFYPKINTKKKSGSAEDEASGSSNSNGNVSAVGSNSTSTITKPMNENDGKERAQNGEVADRLDEKDGEASNTENGDNRETVSLSNGCAMDTDETSEKTEECRSKDGNGMLDMDPGPTGSGINHDEAVPHSSMSTMDTEEHSEKAEDKKERSSDEKESSIVDASPGPSGSDVNHDEAMPQSSVSTIDTKEHSEKAEDKKERLSDKKESSIVDASPAPSGSDVNHEEAMPSCSSSSN